MIDALVGFSSAFGKIARRQFSADYGHRIRVVGVEKGSAKIVIDVLEWANQNPAVAASLVIAGGAGAYKVLKDLIGVFNGKRALEGKPLSQDKYTFVNNGIILQGVPLTREQFEYLQSGDLDPDLDKMTAPLEEGRGVDEFELRGGNESVRVNSKERPFFVNRQESLTSTADDVWLEGTLNSHSKRSNRGMFYTLSGKHIPYHYVGDHLDPLLRGYAYM